MTHTLATAPKDEAGLLRTLLERLPSAAPLEDLPAPVPVWWHNTEAARGRWAASIDQAILSGFLADCVGHAFAGGYEAALRALLPSLPPEVIVSLNITEQGGGHPRALLTRLEPAGDGTTDGLLSGEKRWNTLVCEADLLLVAASIGTTLEGLNRLVLVQLPADLPGISVVPMAALPFVPEVSHGTLKFDAVRVPMDAVLEGDAYVRYIKPFRTLEDLHVSAAILGHLLRITAAYHLPRSLQETLIGLLVTARALEMIAQRDPAALELHIALGGFFTLQDELLERLEPHWSQIPPGVSERWRRDAPLRQVAGKARAKRLEVAWNRLNATA